jgi:predicted nucleic acid-binding protein
VIVVVAVKNVVCDSSTLISLAETCNISCLQFLRERAPVNFVIPPSVYNEIISCPINLPQFEFSAVRLSKILADGTISLYSPPGLKNRTQKILRAANNVLRVDGRPLEILHAGEAECLAVCSEAGAAALAIDEKTTRLLLEDPRKLWEAVSSEYGGRLSFNELAAREFRSLACSVAVIRSSEIIAVAALKGFFAEYGEFEDEAFHSALYALRRAGCSLPLPEVGEYKRVRLGAQATRAGGLESRA